MTLEDIIVKPENYDQYNLSTQSVDVLFPRPTIVAMGNLLDVVYGAWDKEGGFYIWQPDYGTWKEVSGSTDFTPAVAKMDGWKIYVGNDMELKGEIVYWLP